MRKDFKANLLNDTQDDMKRGIQIFKLPAKATLYCCEYTVEINFTAFWGEFFGIHGKMMLEKYISQSIKLHRKSVFNSLVDKH